MSPSGFEVAGIPSGQAGHVPGPPLEQPRRSCSASTVLVRGSGRARARPSIGAGCGRRRSGPYPVRPGDWSTEVNSTAACVAVRPGTCPALHWSIDTAERRPDVNGPRSGRARARPSIGALVGVMGCRPVRPRQAGHVPGPPLERLPRSISTSCGDGQAGHVPGPPLELILRPPTSRPSRHRWSGRARARPSIGALRSRALSPLLRVTVRPGTCPALHWSADLNIRIDCRHVHQGSGRARARPSIGAPVTPYQC